jgi:hypothetical protein
MSLTHLTWLAAEYHLPSLYSCRVPMSSMNSAQALPAPGPATVRLALIRTSIEVFGLVYTRDELFPHIRAMEIRIRPPERVALTMQTLHAFKVDEQAGGTRYSTAPISREAVHASGPLTVYIEVSSQEVSQWEAILRTIGYWGQSSSLAYCIGVHQGPPDPKECVIPLRDWRSPGQLAPFFSSILSEFRNGMLSWDEVMPVLGVQKVEPLALDVYVWPLVIAEQHGRGRLLLRRAFA